MQSVKQTRAEWTGRPLAWQNQAAAQRCYAALLAEGRASGFFPYRFGIGGMASLLDLAPEAAAFNRRIQAAHDPQQLLAPGRYR